MATTHLHGSQFVDTQRSPKISAAMKMVASVAAILFAMCGFVLPNAIARVVTAIVAVGFGVIGALPPMSPKVWIRVLAWMAAGLAIASICVAVFRAVGADTGPAVHTYGAP